VTQTVSRQPLVDVHARITRAMYESVLAECGHCTCSITGFVRTAIAHELSRRSSQRTASAQQTILAGQIDIEGHVNG
jgi:hypothetical protein